MFPYSPAWAKTPEARNAERDTKIRDQVKEARLAAQRIVDELKMLEDSMAQDLWTDMRKNVGGHYNLANAVGRTFGELSHPLRYIHDSAILAAAYAGGYEQEEA